MKKYLYLIVLSFVFCLNQNVLADPVENDFGIVNAWYNGQEATVKNVSLKIGEPIEITVFVYSKIAGNVYVKLINPLVTIPYDIISGPTELDKTIDNYDVKSGWTMNYTWIIKPNGEWTNGNAPINIFVQFSKDYDEYEHVQFTIANPIILDEQYSGSNPSHTTIDPSSTDQSQSNSSPSFGIIAALLSVALVVMWREKKI
ncbi:MAG: sarcinarray family MAST domain-containing protein [Methanosarcinales archaeon]|nr:sarcinarray family MAST domain-containing protein [Methanosarcinales archaeon]